MRRQWRSQWRFAVVFTAVASWVPAAGAAAAAREGSDPDMAAPAAPSAFSRARFHRELLSASQGVTGEPAEQRPAQPALAAAWDRFIVAAHYRTEALIRRRLATRHDEIDDRNDMPSAFPDDLEAINRRIHDFNKAMSDFVVDPAASYYLANTSPGVQRGVANFFFNLREPVTVGSSLLQGSFADAGNSSVRFAINSTFGLLGIYDQASDLGFQPAVRTLDETFCTYGVPPGPYVVMPFFGPASSRDAAGRVTTMVAQYLALGPLVIPYRIADTAAQYVEAREQIKFVDKIDADTYETYKTLNRQMQILPCREQAKLARRLFGR